VIQPDLKEYGQETAVDNSRMTGKPEVAPGEKSACGKFTVSSDG
jgi:hypothetical protein